MKNIKSERALRMKVARQERMFKYELYRSLEDIFINAGHDERLNLSETKEDVIVRDMQGD